MPRLLTILLFTVIAALPARAQALNEQNFVRYSKQDGLSHNQVNGIAQDATGYIWLSTPSGLNRYNGADFVQFHSNEDSLSPASEYMAGMTWLDKYRLAIVTTGLHIVDTRTGKTRNLFIPYHNKQFQYKFNMVMKAIGDDKGNVFVLSRSGFYQFDSSYRLVFRFDYYPESEVPFTHFVFGGTMVQADSERFIIISVNGLYIYNKNTRQLRKMTAADCPHLAEFLNKTEMDCQFLQLKPGHLVILKNYSDSLVYVNVLENKKKISLLPFDSLRSEFRWRTRLVPICDSLFYLTSYFSGFFKLKIDRSGAIQFYPEKYFPTYLVNTLLKDRDNNLWVGTNKGLFRQDAGKSQVHLAFIPQALGDSFANVRINDVYATADKVYAGTLGSGGLLIFDKKTFHFLERKSCENCSEWGNNIYSIASPDPSSLILGTGRPLLLFKHSNKEETQLIPPLWDQEHDWISELFKDSKGNIWVSATYVYRYTPKTRTFTYITREEQLKSNIDMPVCIREDTAGNMWMAGHGIARYNISSGHFDRVLDSFPFIKMQDKQVRAMAIDKKNNIWFSSINNGLICYNIDRGGYRHFTTKDGLPDNSIAALLIIGDKLWIACYAGIACMDMLTHQIVHFGKEDGFPDMPVNDGSNFFYDSSARQLYLGFTHAIARFDPNAMLQKKQPPYVFVESLFINGRKEIPVPDRDITTSWQNNNIAVTIGSINFLDANNQRFAYRIVQDQNTPWQQTGSQPSFNISNLSPGQYRIQVKSYSVNNRWAEQVKEIGITVLSPFWQRTGFVILFALLALILTYRVITWRIGNVRMKEMENTHIEKIKADYYKDQFELEQISNYFSSSLAGKKNVDEVLWDVTNNLISRLKYVDCMIYLWNEDKTKMIQKAAYGPKGSPEAIRSHVFDVVKGQGVVGYVMEKQEPLLIPDTRKDIRYRVDEMMRMSEICVPIIHNNELIGIIDSEHPQINYYKARDLQILTTIATLVGNKIKQIESEQSLKVKQEEITAINLHLAEAQLSALQTQMNPHFIFNSLNSIKRMILDNMQEEASKYLSKFAHMIRLTLNQSKEIFATLPENIEYLESYLEMEKLRFDGSFTYLIEVDDFIDEDETQIPTLMIQPLAENAIWHGLMHKEGEKKLLIRFSRNGDTLTCTIEDNGIGIRQSERLKKLSKPHHQSVGLGNIRNRIKIMNEKYDAGCSIVLTDRGDIDKSQTGTLVILRFNIICHKSFA